MAFKFGQKIIDIIRGKKSEEDIYFDYVKKLQPILKAKIRNKIKNGEKVNVCFAVVYDSVFPAQHIYEIMKNDKAFSPYILVIPDVARGKANMINHMKNTYNNLSKKYTNVYMAYDFESDKYLKIPEGCDMLCTANFYDAMTYKYYQIKNNLTNFLIFYIDYGYIVSNWHKVLAQPNNKYIEYIYKHFIQNKQQCGIFSKKSVQCFGNPKMDKLHNIKKVKSKRKRIIIAPHHTVDNSIKDYIYFSNFLQYSDFFLELPKKYKEIDWVFRPHPLLFVTLKNNNIWTDKQIEEYIKNLKSNPNLEYQNGGDYFETFVNSDGLIHDCGSFMAEYLFTEHPACYLLKDSKTNKYNYNKFAESCINQHYKAYNTEQIIDFIENIIIKGDDYKKEKRITFFNKNLKYEYPNTSQKIVNYLKQDLIK